MSILFKTVRLNALKNWCDFTSRKLEYKENSLFPTIENTELTFECKWQRKNWEFHVGKPQENNHVSIFCSLNSWASHLTDILTDESLDSIPLYAVPIDDQIELNGETVTLDREIYEKLCRYYGRFFLVVSELIVDFGDIAKKLGEKEDYYSKDNVIDYGHLRGYINNVFKHKVENFHSCNHHIPILFNDGLEDEKYEAKSKEYLVEIGCKHKYKLKGKNYILSLPKLERVILFIAICYVNLDTLLTDSKIEDIAKEYGDLYP